MNKLQFVLQKGLFLLLLVTAACNPTTNEKHKTVTKQKNAESYYLPVPTGWTTETMPFPIEFAPGIPFTGTEDLRFAKGWGDIISEEHWCYAFAWWISGKPTIDEGLLKKYLEEYYGGLVGRNIIRQKIAANKVVPVVASVKRLTTMNGDNATYKATISMLDYHAEVPINLNCMIHLKACNATAHSALLFQLSPKPYDHPVWKVLNTLNTSFNCGN
jgi:hypothetical protein